MTGLLREYWDWFLLDTLLWTGALIALVLLLRRPVSRHFGSGAAYALWFLPLVRLAFPPVRLPAWMQMATVSDGEAVPVEAAALEAAPIPDGFTDVAMVMPVDVASAPAPMASPIDFVTPLAIVWLLGATIFLVRRFWLYGALRKELLAEARPVGEVGNIRLIETPAISGPMAFGVLDKVVALPAGFIASRDRQARDLAIEHELAHHRGHDLLVNVLVQPLFAAHWFNPLGWMGWNALRRDQEAACDARVVAARPREERAAYAGIIAEFARRPHVAPRPALAAPMACPVLGDKSIIHRLRSLSMSDISPRRRWVGRTGIGAALLALPMTASICYSQAYAAPEAPQPPAAPLAALAPAAPLAPEPPTAPDAPEAPEAPSVQAVAEAEQDLRESEREMARAEREMERAERQLERASARAVAVASSDGRTVTYSRAYRAANPEAYAEGRRQWADGRIQYAESRKQWADGRIDWAEGRREWAKSRVEWAKGEKEREWGWHGDPLSEEQEAKIEREVEMALAKVPAVIENCRNPDQPVTSGTDRDGRPVLYVCDKAGDRLAQNAIRSAREAIARDEHLSDEIRAEILDDLDRELAEFDG